MRHAPQHGLMFVHIPKNGGRNFADLMAPFAAFPTAAFAADLGIGEAEMADRHFGAVHPALGPFHPQHVPLAVLRDSFPAVWQSLSGATTLAFTRDPRARFFSALLQRLAEFEGMRGLRVDDAVIVREARAVCAFLDRHGDVLDPRYIHFSRQCAYTHLDGRQHVDRLFPVDRLDLAARWLQHSFAIEIEAGHRSHARRQPRRWFRTAYPVVRAVGRRALPAGLRKRLYARWTGSFLFDDAAGGYGAQPLPDDVESFIGTYYAADWRLHEDAVAGCPPADEARLVSAAA